MRAAPTSWPWQRLNQGNANAHEVLATLLEPRAGERWLDVGTGGGGLAFRLARDGASVVGVDIAEDGLEHARAEAAKQGAGTTFEHGDAQELPFEDASFDGVTSAFGVIFAADRERAARELGRVCRQHPATWPDDVDRLLGDAFELEVERRDSPSPPTPFPSWDEALEEIGRRYAERPASYHIVLGRRR